MNEPTTAPVPTRPVLALVRDLMFASKVRAAASNAGRPLTLLRDPAALATADGTKLLVDLNQADAIPAAAAWRRRTGGAVVGFVSHVDKETIAAAREAGIDQVMARSRFVEVLGELMRER